MLAIAREGLPRHPGIKVRIIPTEDLTQELAVKVPLDKTLADYTDGENGAVRAWLNNSIIRWQGKLLMAYRMECFPFWRNGRTGMCELTEEFDPIPGTASVLPVPGRLAYGESEDPRFVVLNGRLHLAYNNGCRQHLSCFNEDLSIGPTVQIGATFPLAKREKNWSFFSHDSHVYAVYSCSPHHVVRIFTNVADPASKEPWPFEWPFGIPRGGASPVLHDGLWYHFFHSAVNRLTGATDEKWLNPRRYFMGLYTFEDRPPFRPVECTRLPLLCGENNPPWPPTRNRWPSNHLVVFPSGAYRNDANDGWIVSAGINDCYSSVITIPDRVTEELLAP